MRNYVVFTVLMLGFAFSGVLTVSYGNLWMIGSAITFALMLGVVNIINQEITELEKEKNDLSQRELVLTATLKSIDEVLPLLSRVNSTFWVKSQLDLLVSRIRYAVEANSFKKLQEDVENTIVSMLHLILWLYKEPKDPTGGRRADRGQMRGWLSGICADLAIQAGWSFEKFSMAVEEVFLCYCGELKIEVAKYPDFIFRFFGKAERSGEFTWGSKETGSRHAALPRSWQIEMSDLLRPILRERDDRAGAADQTPSGKVNADPEQFDHPCPGESDERPEYNHCPQCGSKDLDRSETPPRPPLCLACERALEAERAADGFDVWSPSSPCTSCGSTNITTSTYGTLTSSHHVDTYCNDCHRLLDVKIEGDPEDPNQTLVCPECLHFDKIYLKGEEERVCRSCNHTWEPKDDVRVPKGRGRAGGIEA